MFVLCVNRRGCHTWKLESQTGLFYFANRLEQLGIEYKYGSVHDVSNDDILCISSLQNDHVSILGANPRKIIVGGKGALAPLIISDDVELLQIVGSISNISSYDIEMSGTIEKDKLPSDIEIPSIPDSFLVNMKVVPFNNGYGCFYNKCLFCNRTEAKTLSPEITALSICEICKQYKMLQVQLSMDSPTWPYLQNISEELLKQDCECVKWGASIRASDITFKRLQQLRKSGLISIGVGIEYLSDDVLVAIKKGIVIDDIYRTINAAMKNDMYLHLCLIKFDDYIPVKLKNEHYKNLSKILKLGYNKISFSYSELSSNEATDKALERLQEKRINNGRWVV